MLIVFFNNSSQYWDCRSLTKDNFTVEPGDFFFFSHPRWLFLLVWPNPARWHWPPPLFLWWWRPGRCRGARRGSSSRRGWGGRRWPSALGVWREPFWNASPTMGTVNKNKVIKNRSPLWKYREKLCGDLTIGLIKRSYLGGFRVKPSPTKQTLVTIRFQAFFCLFPVLMTLSTSVSPWARTLGRGTSHLPCREEK